MTATETRPLPLGTHVYCTVPAVRGWYTITSIRMADGYIKIEGHRTWNPPHNFALTDAYGREWA